MPANSPATVSSDLERNLRSRIAQLELMYDRERKKRVQLEHGLLLAQQQSGRPPGVTVGTPASDHAVALSPAAYSPILSSDSHNARIRRMSTELEAERRLKADLLANLKETTDGKSELERELISARKARDDLQARLAELQDEFDEIGAAVKSQLHDRHRSDDSGGVIAQEATPESSPSPETQSMQSTVHRLSPASLRQLVQNLESGYEGRHRTSLNALLGPDADDTLPLEALARRLQSRLSRPAELDASTIVDLCMLLEHLGLPADDPARDVQERLSDALRRALHRILALEADASTYRQFLVKVVPTYIESIFGTLSRTASFHGPDDISLQNGFDAPQQETYRRFLTTNTDSLAHTLKKYISSHNKSRQKISYRSFSVGDLALFLPTRNGGPSGAWAAFNVQAPHYFLDMRQVRVDGKDFLIGRIERIEERVGEPGVLEGSQLAPTSNPSSAGATDSSRRWWLVQITQRPPNPANSTTTGQLSRRDS
ncbi:oligomeric, coiled-coil, peripheral membrane protein [Savitreella phatthalungensis]